METTEKRETIFRHARAAEIAAAIIDRGGEAIVSDDRVTTDFGAGPVDLVCRKLGLMRPIYDQCR